MGVDANREPAPGGPAEANDDQHTGLNKAYLVPGQRISIRQHNDFATNVAQVNVSHIQVNVSHSPVISGFFLKRQSQEQLKEKLINCQL